VLLCFVAMSWGNLALVALSLNPSDGAGGARQTAARRLFPTLMLSLLLAVAMIALLAVALAVILPLSGIDLQLAMSGGPADIPPGRAGVLGLGLLALAVCLLWLYARLVLFSPIMVAERRGIRVFSRSFALTRGLGLKIMGVLLLYSVVSWVAANATKFVFGSILRLLDEHGGVLTLSNIVTTILVSLVTTVFMVLAATFTGKLYLAVRDVREAIVDSL
jgi:hypothetical protein